MCPSRPTLSTPASSTPLLGTAGTGPPGTAAGRAAQLTHLPRLSAGSRPGGAGCQPPALAIQADGMSLPCSQLGGGAVCCAVLRCAVRPQWNPIDCPPPCPCSRDITGGAPLRLLWRAISAVPGVPGLLGSKTVPQVCGRHALATAAGSCQQAPRSWLGRVRARPGWLSAATPHQFTLDHTRHAVPLLLDNELEFRKVTCSTNNKNSGHSLFDSSLPDCRRARPPPSLRAWRLSWRACQGSTWRTARWAARCQECGAGDAATPRRWRAMGSWRAGCGRRRRQRLLRRWQSERAPPCPAAAAAAAAGGIACAHQHAYHDCAPLPPPLLLLLLLHGRPAEMAHSLSIE